MRNPNPPELLSVVQAAKELGIPSRTLHHRIVTGKVAATKVGDGKTSAYVIARAEIDRLKGTATTATDGAVA